MRLTWIAVVGALAFAGGCDSDEEATGDGSEDTAGVPMVSYAACDDPAEGCEEDDCARRSLDGTDYSICVPPCTESADCPIGAGGNVTTVCNPEGRCVLECVVQVMSCPTGTICVDGDPPWCMWPGS